MSCKEKRGKRCLRIPLWQGNEGTCAEHHKRGSFTLVYLLILLCPVLIVFGVTSASRQQDTREQVLDLTDMIMEVSVLMDRVRTLERNALLAPVESQVVAWFPQPPMEFAFKDTELSVEIEYGLTVNGPVIWRPVMENRPEPEEAP